MTGTKLVSRDDKGRFQKVANKPQPEKLLNRIVSLRELRAHNQIRANYDAAQTTDENKMHWVHADSLSADEANSASVRKTIRDRARYEIANNSYAKGITLTIANYTIGTGPRLQLLTDDSKFNFDMEKAWAIWGKVVGLATKLQTMVKTEIGDGESFTIVAHNPTLQAEEKVDLLLVDAEQVTSDFGYNDTRDIDGVRIDKFGRPINYRVLTEHPGGSSTVWNQDYDIIPANFMIHLFRADRPGQHRGISQITPALALFAILRRYTLATVFAAEYAASFAGILHTMGPPADGADAIQALIDIELERNVLLTVPAGWGMSQVKAEHPNTTYVEFTDKILNEIARCLNVPFNIAAGNSSGYNYASGRLDFQAFDKSISVDQNTIEIEALDRVFVIWLEQYFSARGIRGPVPAHQWFLDGLEHVDPAKEANAQATRLANHTTNLAIECGKAGRDWEEVLRQAARERDVMQELELIPGGWVMPPGGYIPEDGEGAAESGADTDEDETGEGEK